MKKNRILTAALAGALSLSLAVPALGTRYDNVGTSASDAKTVFGIVHEQVVPTNVSYEVPLYVTMVRTDNTADLMVPSRESYFIRNNGDVGIQVTKVAVQRTSTESYFFVSESAPNAFHGYRALYMEIGGVMVPGLNDAEARDTRVKRPEAFRNTSEINLPIENSDNDFYTIRSDADKSFDVIAPSATLPITLVGRVAPYMESQILNTELTKYGVAQFKVKYTVAPVNTGSATGKAPYAGDTWNDAHMNKFGVTEDAFNRSQATG